MAQDYDPFLVPPEPSNPWVSDSSEFWDNFEKCNRDQVQIFKKNFFLRY
jgi:hypothetical protein